MLASDGPGALTTRAVARAAGTSVPAVYELFGDKAGLVRELFFTGFRRLHERLLAESATGDPRSDLVSIGQHLSRVRAGGAGPGPADVLAPVAQFDPSPADARAGAAVRDLVVERVTASVRAGVLAGDPVASPTSCWRPCRGLPFKKPADGWARRPGPSSAVGSWPSTRC